MRYNPQKAREAVQYLVDTIWFPHRVRGLRSNLKRPRALPYKGEEECLNELLVIGRQDAQAFENLIFLAQLKRGDAADDPKARRNKYQAELMAKQRTRERRVARIEELLVGKRLTADERVETLRRYNVEWDRQLEEFMAAYADCSWEEKNTVRREFWAQVDAGLEQLLEEAERELTREVHRKKRITVDKQLKNPTLRDKLQEKLGRHIQKQ